MKETGIMFSTAMIQALPYKTQTRRTRGLEQINEAPNRWKFREQDLVMPQYYIFDRDDNFAAIVKCPYGVKGDALWCRETWYPKSTWNEGKVIYKAEHDHPLPAGYRWKSAMFMPRWASRHLLELVKNPIPQRVQKITWQDAVAEGIDSSVADGETLSVKNVRVSLNNEENEGNILIALYRELWDSLNKKKYPWEANPWCWKLCFKEIKQ